MPVSNHDILKSILLQELDRMEPEQSTFEDDPMQFILRKYVGLKNTLEYLMTPSFEEYITGIYVVAPKPTTFKIVLHNGQFFFLQFMGKAYEATVEGKKYYLMSIGEKERCMVAISRLLRFGNPLKTQGPEGAEQGTRDSEGPAEEAGPTPPAETGGEEAGAGGEELTEAKILEGILKKNLTVEFTVSPNYKTKEGFNPYYVLQDNIKNDVAKKLKLDPEKVVFKSVFQPKGKPVLDRKGKFFFQVAVDNNGTITDTEYYVQTTKAEVVDHYGTKKRKDSTASSNVNELLTVYFLINNFKGTPEKFIEFVKSKKGSTGVKTGDGSDVTYEMLSKLLDKDETPERDIAIGINNAKAVKADIGGNIKSISQVYWTPRAKPEGVGSKNPSDVFIKFKDGNFLGYSNKITDKGPDSTPKFNTSLSAFASKVGDKKQDKNIKQIVDSSWNQAAESIITNRSLKAPNTKKALKDFDIEKENHSETTSRGSFANLAREFQKDGLDFYGKDFYHLFRNQLIQNIGSYWKKPTNLNYLLKTIAYYTYGEVNPEVNDVPYKLLIGTETGSTIKDVTSDDESKMMLTKSTPENIKKIQFIYGGTGQSFDIKFYSDLIQSNVTIPLTLRTRASGGWAGKSLYINTSGLKIGEK